MGSRGSLGYYPHTGTELAIFLHGFRTEPKGKIFSHQKAPQGFTRGKCTELTPEVRQRLRTALLTLTRADSKVLDTTLTIPGELTPDEWRDTTKRFRMKLLRRGLAMIWRVELQKRKMPHIHAAIFAPADQAAHAWGWVQVDWLQSLPEKNRNHPGALRHAVHIKGPFSDVEQSPRWLEYLTGHASKAKKEQLGWIGKQWGIVGNKLLTERAPLLKVMMNDHQEKWLKRTLSRYLLSLSRSRYIVKRKAGHKSRRPRRMWFRNGCRMTRIMDPKTIAKLGQWAMIRA